jgi:DNA invertase Pin-like site-specific DNA recombinase
MAIAKAAGKLRGRKPKLTPSQEKHLVQLHRTGAHTTSGIAELFGVARSTVYRTIQRAEID